jgi:hypothetical protein
MPVSIPVKIVKNAILGEIYILNTRSGRIFGALNQNLPNLLVDRLNSGLVGKSVAEPLGGRIPPNP